MPDWKEKYAEVMQALAQQRDELRLQAHLGKAEAKEEMDRLETKWLELKAKWDRFKDEADDVGENVEEAAELLVGELKEGFARLRKLV